MRSSVSEGWSRFHTDYMAPLPKGFVQSMRIDSRFHCLTKENSVGCRLQAKHRFRSGKQRNPVNVRSALTRSTPLDSPLRHQRQVPSPYILIVIMSQSAPDGDSVARLPLSFRNNSRSVQGGRQRVVFEEERPRLGHAQSGIVDQGRGRVQRLVVAATTGMAPSIVAR